MKRGKRTKRLATERRTLEAPPLVEAMVIKGLEDGDETTPLSVETGSPLW